MTWLFRYILVKFLSIDRFNPFTADPVKALPYWFNPLYLISDIRAPEMSKIKNGGLDQYGAEPFEQHQFGTAGINRVKI